MSIGENQEIEMPQGWTRCKLVDFTLITMGQSPPSSTYNSEGIGLPFYQGKSEFGTIYPTPRVYCSTPKKVAERGDVLLSIRAPVGPTNIAPHKSCIGRGLAAIRPLDGIETKFILFSFRNIEPQLSKRGTGTTFKAITKEFLEGTEFFLPPLPEQRAIVAKIEELFSKLDKGIESLKKAREQLKVYRQAVLKWAFEGKLTESNVQSWNISSLKQILSESLIGLVRSNKEQNTEGKGVPYIKMNNIDLNGKVDTENVVFVEATQDEIEKFKLKKGDVLLNTRNSFELVGKTGIVRDDSIERVFNNNIMRMRFKKNIDPFFICFQLVSPDLRKQMTKEKKATTNVCALYQKDILPLRVRYPNLKEQNSIVQEIESRFSIAEKLEQTIDESLRKAETLRQSILKKAFEGKLLNEQELEAVRKDPEWEPAEKLLEKIKAEKEKMKAQSKKGSRKKQMKLFS